MTTVNLADKQTLKRMRAEIEEALSMIDGVKFALGNITYDADGQSFRTKLTCSTDDALPEWSRTFQKEIHLHCSEAELSAADLGSRFQYGGREVELVGLRPRSSKNPIIVKDVKGGKMWKVAIASVVSALGRKGVAPVERNVLQRKGGK